MTTIEVADVVDHAVGITPGDRLDQIRRARPTTRDNIQAAHRALFGESSNGIDLSARYLVAAFVAELSDPGSSVARWYAERVDDPAVLNALLESAAQFGPWGTYREPKLSSASEPGEWWEVPDEYRDGLTPQVAAVLEHAHFLVLHPRDARPKVLGRLAAAGWARPQIVTWSQLISFVSFQVRAAAGFTVLAEQVTR